MVNAEVLFETSSKNRRISFGPKAQFKPKLQNIQRQ
jgi:hypothetical protein